MEQQFLENRGRHGGHVGSHHGGLGHVPRVADRGGQDLGFQSVVVEHEAGFPHDVHRVVPDVVEAAQERRYVGCSGLRSQEALHGAERERHVDLDPVGHEPAGGHHPFLQHRDLDHDVVRQFSEFPPLGVHPIGVHRYNLGTHGPVHQRADLLEHIGRLDVAGALREQRRVGRHTVDQSRLGRPPNVAQICRVEEKFHR